jgi:hypothetical protein
VAAPRGQVSRNQRQPQPDQLFYYDTDFMLRRMDYAPEVTANSPVAHYTHDPKTFHGFVFPTRRRIHRRDVNGIADQTVAAITLDVTQVTIEAEPVGKATGADPVEPSPAADTGRDD